MTIGRDSSPAPVGFDDFWRGLHARARAVDPAQDRRPTGDPRVELVRFTSLGGVRIGGWYLRPAGEPSCAVLVSHGYGGRSLPDPSWLPEGAAGFFPVARGLPTLSAVRGIPGTGAAHVLHGIGSRDDYVHGGCVADMWIGATVLGRLLDRRLGERRGGLRLGYAGASFGGGIGAMALPWDARFDAAALHVPSFGDHDARLAVDCVGSGQAVKRHVAAHPEAREVLRYFDAATSAERIAVPTVVAPAHEDPAVPPAGQWAVARAVPEERRTIVPMTAGHKNHPEEEAELEALATAARRLFLGP